MIFRQVGRRAVTLVELLVVLAILGVVASVATLSGARLTPLAPDPASATIAHARSTAIAFGHAITTLVAVRGRPRGLTAFPDGRVVSDSTLGVEPLTGARENPRHSGRSVYVP